MQKFFHLEQKPYLNNFVYENENIFLEDGNSYTITSNEPIWITLNDHDTDIVILSDGSSKYRVPSLQIFRDLAHENDLDNRSPDDLNIDLSQAQLDELSTRRIGSHDLETSVTVAIDDAYYELGKDFSFHSDHIIFDVPIPAEKEIRIKWESFLYCEGNGSTKVKVNIPKNYQHQRKLYVNDASYKKSSFVLSLKTPTQKKHTHYVSERMPNAVSGKYEVFEKFLEDYFDLVGEKEGIHDFLMNLNEYRDIDLTSKDFVDAYRKERLGIIPNTKLRDSRFLIKRILDFYRIRGTEKSYQFLMRILYNTAAKLYYPSERIFKGSDAKWIENYSLKIISLKQAFDYDPSLSGKILNFFSREIYSSKNDFGDYALLKSLEGSVIEGVESRAYATVENVIQTEVNGFVVTELILSNVRGYFAPGEIFFPSNILKENFVSEFESLFYYHGIVGSQVTEMKPLEYAGEVDFSKVCETNNDYPATVIPKKQKNGKLYFHLIDGGFSYSPEKTITYNNLNCEYVISALRLIDGYWDTNNSLASDSYIRPQDNYFFQIYSYVVSSDLYQTQYFSEIKNILHPAGFKMFSEVDKGYASVNGNLSGKEFIEDVSKYNYTLGSIDDFDVYIDGKYIDQSLYSISVEENALDLEEFGEFGSEKFNYGVQADTRIEYNTTYDDPVVVASITNANNQHYNASIFIKMVEQNKTGFTFSLLENSNALLDTEDNIITTENGSILVNEQTAAWQEEDVSFLVLEKGNFEYRHGVFEANTTEVTPNTQVTINFDEEFADTPNIFAMPILGNTPAYFRIHSVNLTGFVVEVFSNEADPIDLNWIAVSGVDRLYQASLDNNTITYSHQSVGVHPPLISANKVENHIKNVRAYTDTEFEIVLDADESYNSIITKKEHFTNNSKRIVVLNLLDLEGEEVAIFERGHDKQKTEILINEIV